MGKSSKSWAHGEGREVYQVLTAEIGLSEAWGSWGAHGSWPDWEFPEANQEKAGEEQNAAAGNAGSLARSGHSAEAEHYPHAGA